MASRLLLSRGGIVGRGAAGSGQPTSASLSLTISALQWQLLMKLIFQVCIRQVEHMDKSVLHLAHDRRSAALHLGEAFRKIRLPCWRGSMRLDVALLCRSSETRPAEARGHHILLKNPLERCHQRVTIAERSISALFSKLLT